MKCAQGYHAKVQHYVGPYAVPPCQMFPYLLCDKQQRTITIIP